MMYPEDCPVDKTVEDSGNYWLYFTGDPNESDENIEARTDMLISEIKNFAESLDIELEFERTDRQIETHP